MIKRSDIVEFFDLEAEASKKSWDALMSLSVKDRIRKRKAISEVYLDKGDHGYSPEGEMLLQVSFAQNLSDFKEGERLVLHKEDSISGIECTLNEFVGDNTILVSVYNRRYDLNLYYDVPLILDKDYVDLRDLVYNPFINELTSEDSYWNDNIFNTQKKPSFENDEKNEEYLLEAIKYLKLDLTAKQHEAIVRCMSAKDYYLVQGPPGTGKSFVLSLIILEELLSFNRRVIVIGPNHMAINNTLEAVVKIAPGLIGRIIKIGQSYNAPTIEIQIGDDKLRIFNTDKASHCEYDDTPLPLCDEPLVIGMTPHSFYSSRGRDMTCDTLVIDEAGQMTIPLALMGMLKAKKVIFAGDYKQLPPIVTSELVKGEMKLSAFQKLISEANCTMLDISYRMCEPICDFVSELFYEGKVKAQKKGYNDAVICSDPQYSFNSPIILNNIEDNGEQTSDKEALFITELISTYINKHDIKPSDIAVLSPFRAQAANIKRHLRKLGSLNDEQWQSVAVDTVDKMQGQEKEVIIFSMTAGNPDYISEMADFLLNPNKLNVAFSRAKSKLIIVGNINRIKAVDKTEYPHIDKMIKSEYATIIGIE